MKQFFRNFKQIISCIKYSPGYFNLYFTFELWDGFQSIYRIVVLSSIIGAIEIGSKEKLYFWVIVFCIIMVINLFINLFKNGFDSLFFTKVESKLLKYYLNKYIILDNTKVEEYGTGKMSNIIFKGVKSSIELLFLVVAIVVEILSIIYIFLIILYKVPNIYYFIGFVVLFFLMVYFIGKGISVINKYKKQIKELDVEVDSKKVKILMSKFEIFQNNKIDKELDSIGEIYNKLGKLWWKGNLGKNLRQSLTEILGYVLYLIIFLIIGIGVINKNYDLAYFSLLIWLIQTQGTYIWQIRNYVRGCFNYYIDVEKLFDTFEKIPKYKDDSNLPDFEYKNGTIKLDNLYFSYNNSSEIFKDFSLNLEGGKKYAFVGPSGGGKSTLIKLIAGYINPTEGNVIIDNHKLGEIKLKSYYKHIGYLTQDPSVFDGSIYENLVYALNYEPTNSQIQDVIKSSKCEFIYELKDGINTQIGEKGIKLSGGQKQRLAIAKIMLKNPEIILLDEPTSALDSFNEEEVSIAFQNLFKDKTVIVVAHRLQTVKNSDIIFYLEKGKIVEMGNHEELLALKGKYYRMIELQSGF